MALPVQPKRCYTGKNIQTFSPNLILNCIEHARLKVISVGFGCLQRCFFKVICLLRHRYDTVHCPESIFRSEFKNAQLLTIENINWTVINLKEVFVCTVVCGICRRLQFRASIVLIVGLILINQSHSTLLRPYL